MPHSTPNDTTKALGRADEHLRQFPRGPGSVDALYLRGRALEQKPPASAQEARANLQAVRDAYSQALALSPPHGLRGKINAGLGNCSYFLDDYATALRQWTDAYDELESADDRAWVLYRMGICRQRMGQFDLADQIFAKVQQEYPNTVQSQRAREHAGVRGFTVQLATFESPASADRAIATLRGEGALATRATDPKGRSIVRVGPMTSYQQALAIKQRYASQYPDALILP